MESKKNIAVLGAGISGLTAAYLLHKENYDVTVLEKKNEPGGSVETSSEKGFLFDRGPNSGLETTPLIGRIVEELGLQGQFVYASKSANKRYILRGNVLHPLPMSPLSFITTRLFSAKAKMRIFAEPFMGKSNDGYYQSIAEFVKRRLGKEFLEYAINPFVAGVYAGNPEDLSVKSAFPKLFALEEKYGGLIIGTIKSIKERRKRDEKSKQSARLFSFRDGMQVLPGALAAALGKRVSFFSEIKSIEKGETGYRINYEEAGEKKSIECGIIISAVPAYTAAEIFSDSSGSPWDPDLSRHLQQVYYPPVLVLYLGYDKSAIGQPLDGFGFLIPARERKSFLGAIWSSVIFPGRSAEDKAAFTLFVGGARDPEIGTVDKDSLLNRVVKEFQQVMKISGEPVYQTYKYWSKAIPQYNLGYIEHERYFDEFEQNNPGIFLSGNYRGGISIGDCVKNAELVIERVKAFSGQS